MDPLFRVEIIAKTPGPQRAIYAAAHQDYSEDFVFDESDICLMDESECGKRIIKHLLNGGRGHYGPLEHPQITLNCGWFPHSTMQQIRTHRVGVSFDCQSFRYTGKRIYDLGKNYRHTVTIAEQQTLWKQCESVFYLRPVGSYTNRQGKKYEYTASMRQVDIDWCIESALHYANRIDDGLSEEHARGLIPFDVRQHWVMSANVRSLMHILDLRWKADAQLECQQLCDLIWPHFESWVPEIAEWYKDNRAKKARLAP